MFGIQKIHLEKEVRGDAVDDFQRYILQGAVLNGDLGQLVALDPGGLGGVARGIGTLCINDDGKVSYSDVNATFNDVPAFSFTVEVITHELGHLIGSPHTHGCYWNGNNTQIDDCGNIGQASPEGASCYARFNPIVPSNGGTIMSYCHLNPTGINFAHGFGEQPGDLVRIFYNNATCLTPCPVSDCEEPYQVLVTSITTTTALVSWYHATETDFEVTYGNNGNYTTIPVSGTSTTLTNLTSGTKYEVFVKTICDNSESDPIKNLFSTVCDAVYTLPYVELFESDLWEQNSYLLDPCWTSVSGATGYGWSVEQFGTSSAATGPSGDHTTGIGKYVYAEASFGGNGEKAELISPRVDLGSTTDPFVTFWYHMFGADIGNIKVEVSKDNGANWTSLQTITGQQQTGSEADWKQSQLSLSAFEGETIQLRFTATRGATFTGDIAIDDIIITNDDLIDIAVTSIEEPNSGCGLSNAEDVSIVIENTGYQTLSQGSNIALTITLNGSNVASEQLSLDDDLEPGGEIDYTFSTPVNVSTPGVYELSVTAVLASDEIAGNNTRATNLVNKSVVSVYPYTQSFENGSDWTSGGAENSWALGTPAKGIIQGASDGTMAWVTGGLGVNPYNADEESYLEGPCFDFTNLLDPKIEMDVWWEIETIWEGATFQFSTNAGQTWQTLGTANDPDWFNADTITTLPGIDGWSGTDDGDDTFDGSGGWVTVNHDLTGLGENPSVYLRVFFKTDGFVAFDGIGIDNIRITGTSIAPACYNDTIYDSTCDPQLAGTVTEVLQDVNGCDSVVVTITELLASYTINIPEVSCDPGDVGTETVTLSTYQGCDSIINTVTTLAASFDVEVNLTSCNPADTGTVVFSGSTYQGCDSNITTITTLVDPYEVEVNTTSCNPADTGTAVQVFAASDGCDSTVTTITAYTPLVANFTASVNGPVASFSNTSTNATSYTWSFGDGDSSTVASPTHVYTTSGTYTVTLTASADGCPSDEASQTLVDVVSGVDIISFINEINVYPNPNNGNFAVEIKGQSIAKDLNFMLIDVTGKSIESRNVAFNSYAKEIYQLGNLSNGVYFLRIQSDDQVTTLKINILR
ncbi:MAG: PKD domain-containing protein [Chitinophagales bacterium]